MPSTLGVKYRLAFLNRQNTLCTVHILPKDYSGALINLEGSDNPFTLKYASGDGQQINAIRPSEVVIEFWSGFPSSNAVKLADFYNDDDTFYTVRFYVLEVLEWSGFLQLDNCVDILQDTEHVLQLNANDNIGLLEKIDFKTGYINSISAYYTKSVEFRNNIGGAQIIINSTTSIPEIAAGASLVFTTGINAGTYTIISYTYDGTYYICNVGAYFFTPVTAVFNFQVTPTVIVPAQMLLTQIFDVLLYNTTLNLPVAAYLNIFENNTQDRSDVATIDMLQQTVIETSNLQASANEYKTCFDILNSLLTAIRGTLFQIRSTWNIVRSEEYRLFADAAVPGTLYTSRMVVDSAITLSPLLDIGPTEAVIPINENQQSRVLRPYQFVRKTFNYVQPSEIITQSDLSIVAGAVPYESTVVDDIRYDKFSIASYFPAWKQTHGDTSYLQVVTDNITNNEIDRYIYTPGVTNQHRGIQFNNIVVTANDSFEFSLQFKMLTANNDTLRFWVRMILVTASGQYYALVDLWQQASPHWEGPFNVSFWDQTLGNYFEVAPESDKQNWTQWSIINVAGGTNTALPLFPVDGIMLIEVRGTNGTDNSGRQDTVWNNINITFNNAINQNSVVKGQVHTQSQNIAAKSNSATDTQFDDSPINTISGTLLRVPQVTFGANIGALYFYRTVRWHRATLTESLRLGELTSYDDLFSQRKPRAIIEGDFRGIDGVNIGSVLRFSFADGKNFVNGVFLINYMTCIWNTSAYEMYDDDEVDEDLVNVYQFRYLYG